MLAGNSALISAKIEHRTGAAIQNGMQLFQAGQVLLTTTQEHDSEEQTWKRVDGRHISLVLAVLVNRIRRSPRQVLGVCVSRTSKGRSNVSERSIEICCRQGRL